ncbi:MAG TPA: sigma-70 family RNA polymerase sigma factor [Clostridia bacterium]|nr:sigma-70 family RNA polymerase sigma factor [Clostridia bacterium]
MAGIEEPIVENLRTFVSFARKRVADPHMAEDLVQESLVKALAAEHKPTNNESVVPWFYRILRRSIIDLYRRNDARGRSLERLSRELPEAPNAEDERLLCQCFKRLLPAIPAQYQEVITKVDLEGNDLAQVASQSGITKTNLTVRLHRARMYLRKALEKNCKACSKHGCMDCTCDETQTLNPNPPRKNAKLRP